MQKHISPLPGVLGDLTISSLNPASGVLLCQGLLDRTEVWGSLQ